MSCNGKFVEYTVYACVLLCMYPDTRTAQVVSSIQVFSSILFKKKRGGGGDDFPDVWPSECVVNLGSRGSHPYSALTTKLN